MSDLDVIEWTPRGWVVPIRAQTESTVEPATSVTVLAAPMANNFGFMQKCYDSGDYSDLIIRTATRDFKVHKMVVCEQSPVFKAADRGEWKEAQTGVIEVSESAAVMDVLLRHLYKMRTPFRPGAKDSHEVLVRKALPDNFHLALDVLEAADKYFLDELRTDADLTMVNCICVGQVENVVEFLQALEDKDQAGGHVGNLLALAVLKLADNLGRLVTSEERWFTLHTSPNLQRLVVDRAVNGYSDVTAREWFANMTERPESEVAMPSTRPRWYLRNWGTAEMLEF